MNDFPTIFGKEYSTSSLSNKKIISEVSLTVEDGELQAYANLKPVSLLKGKPIR